MMKKKSIIREYVEAILIALLLALFIRTFIVQAFKIPSGSMLPTLQIGDHILVSKFAYALKNPFTDTPLISLSKPEHGDIIVFIYNYPAKKNVDYIKRVVGVAGDRIEIKDKKVFVNGELFEVQQAIHLDTTIYPPEQSPRDNYGPITVPPQSVFVMGDNRDNSNDSRFWGFVNDKAIKGKAFIIYWSWNIDLPLFSLKRLQSIRWDRLGDTIK
ncbi:MAG: signal peptidase I [Proteobacteria bacterium]|nr:signal peptidase I [Pseudomonadota bacterium]MBU1640906.1 signal peptidase I [Pseudomonadota bacterium]